MTHAIDPDFQVAAETRIHPFPAAADALLQSPLSDGHDLAVGPRKSAEFIQIMTDGEKCRSL